KVPTLSRTRQERAVSHQASSRGDRACAGPGHEAGPCETSAGFLPYRVSPFSGLAVLLGAPGEGDVGALCETSGGERSPCLGRLVARERADVVCRAEPLRVALGQTIERFINPRTLSHLWLLANANQPASTASPRSASWRARAPSRSASKSQT